MIGSSGILFVVIIIDLIILALLVARPAMTATRGGKILAFLALLIFPVLAGSLGLTQHMERSKQTEFCLSCHVMQKYGTSLKIDNSDFIPAIHYQNKLIKQDQACFTCHTDYTLYGDLNAKLRGLKHVYVQYLGHIPEKVKLYTPYNNRECLHCHAGARSFEEGATHNANPETLPMVKANKLSCLSCHRNTHDVDQLNDQTFWQPKVD